jgi:hypothetical protein
LHHHHTIFGVFSLKPHITFDNMFKRFSFTISLMALGLYAQAQNNSISQIFYPNITIKTEAIPSANMGDGKDFGLTRTSTLGFVPLSTDFNVGIGFGKSLIFRRSIPF